MNPVWAIIHDTWRQSRQQVVFIIMVVLLVGEAILAVALTGSTTDEQGVEHVELAMSDGPAVSLEASWIEANAQLRLQRGEEDFDPRNPKEALAVKELLVERAKVDAEGTEPVRRGVEMVLFIFSSGAFSLSMLLFIGACSSYFPNMLESGGIDMVLSKPLDRLRIYLGKFLGGMVLFTAAVAFAYFVVFVGIGIRTGVWHGGIFYAMPLQVFSAALLFSILATVGVFFRSSTLCLIVGLVFYIVVDSAVSALIQLNRIHMFEKWPTMEGAAGVIENTLPNFTLLKTNAAASVLSFPSMEAKPLLVGFAWMIGSLALGYWRFSRTDY